MVSELARTRTWTRACIAHGTACGRASRASNFFVLPHSSLLVVVLGYFPVGAVPRRGSVGAAGVPPAQLRRDSEGGRDDRPVHRRRGGQPEVHAVPLRHEQDRPGEVQPAVDRSIDRSICPPGAVRTRRRLTDCPRDLIGR